MLPVHHGKRNTRHTTRNTAFMGQSEPLQGIFGFASLFAFLRLRPGQALRLCAIFLCLPLPDTGAQTPELLIESFGPARAYAVGTDSLFLVGTVRNVGKTPLPANTVTARLYNLAGLEYTVGDTAPKLPALEPNASVTYRWKVQPTGPEAALVASLALEGPGLPPTARVVAIPHFADPPSGDNAIVVKQPTARTGRAETALENTKIRARFALTNANTPVLFLSARTAGGWRQAGVVLPLAEVLSGEGGQRPWWEVFKADEFQPANRKEEAALTIIGRIGLRWRATFDFTLRANSSALDVRLRLSPLRPIKLSGLRLGPFLAGEGSFGAAVSETLPPEPSGPNVVTAVRWGEVTTGMLWPGAPPLPGWQSAPLPNVEGADYRVMGVEMLSSGPPTPLDPGALVEARARLFALTPSAAAADARRITLPAR